MNLVRLDFQERISVTRYPRWHKIYNHKVWRKVWRHGIFRGVWRKILQAEPEVLKRSRHHSILLEIDGDIKAATFGFDIKGIVYISRLLDGQPLDYATIGDFTCHAKNWDREPLRECNVAEMTEEMMPIITVQLESIGIDGKEVYRL